MQEESSFFLSEDLFVPSSKPQPKLRMGGSRSVIPVKARTANLHVVQTSPRSSHECTRSIDSHSSGRSTDSSANLEKVRIVGRGGAGARFRKRKEDDELYTPEIAETEPTPVAVETPVLRTVGRGGLGSRPQTNSSSRSRSKGPRTRQSSLELRDLRKKSKVRNPSPSPRSETQPQSGNPSPVSTISTIHFVGETGLPPPDFFKASRKRPQVSDNDEQVNSLNPHLVRTTGTPTSISRNNIPNKHSISKSKSKRRDRRFSLLFNLFQNDSTHLSAPMPNLPSELTLSSIDTDPSYFFHGPSSPPPTPLGETDSVAETSSSVMESSHFSSFQGEPSILTMPSEEEIDEYDDEVCELDVGDQEDVPEYRRKQFPSIRLSLAVPLSEVEAEALQQSPPSDNPLKERLDHETTLRPRSNKVESWTGEWNVGMTDVIKALRELR